MPGREKSVLQSLDQLGEWSLNRLRSLTKVTHIWKDGQLLVNQFAFGAAAAAVVLTECDMAQLDPINKRLLFVGLTRARYIWNG